MPISKLENLYFDWLVSRVCNSYQKAEYYELLQALYYIPFRWYMNRDENREADGEALRYDFEDILSVRPRRRLDDILPFKCSVLEMLVALSVRCEETIMSDPDEGDRTAKWFWTMIFNLGLEDMRNNRFDWYYVKERTDIFMERRYSRDGSNGGLFVVPNPPRDMRRTEIWYQMNWYLDDLTRGN